MYVTSGCKTVTFSPEHLGVVESALKRHFVAIRQQMQGIPCRAEALTLEALAIVMDASIEQVPA